MASCPQCGRSVVDDGCTNCGWGYEEDFSGMDTFTNLKKVEKKVPLDGGNLLKLKDRAEFAIREAEKAMQRAKDARNDLIEAHLAGQVVMAKSFLLMVKQMLGEE